MTAPDRACLAALLELRQLATDVRWYAQSAHLQALRGNEAASAAAWQRGRERLEKLVEKAAAVETGEGK